MALPERKPVQSPRSDASLIADIRGGNAEAIGTLYERHGKSLLALAYRLLQSTADAEDVVHDVFVGLPEALRRYEERGALTSWLRKITARVALAKIREATARNQVDVANVPTLPHDNPISKRPFRSSRQCDSCHPVCAPCWC